MNLWENQILFLVSNRCPEPWGLIMSAEKIQFNFSSSLLNISAAFILNHKCARLCIYFLTEHLVLFRYLLNVAFFFKWIKNIPNKKPW